MLVSTIYIILVIQFICSEHKHRHNLTIQAHMLSADKRRVLPVNPKLENKVYAKMPQLWGMTTDSFTYTYLCTIY
jgi:hypothetical protein